MPSSPVEQLLNPKTDIAAVLTNLAILARYCPLVGATAEREKQRGQREFETAAFDANHGRFLRPPLHYLPDRGMRSDSVARGGASRRCEHLR